MNFKCIPWRLYHNSQWEQRHFVRHLPSRTCKWFQHCELLYFESITSCALESGHYWRQFWMKTFDKNIVTIFYRSSPETVWIISIALPFIFDIDLSYPYIKSFRSYPAFIGFQIGVSLFPEFIGLNRTSVRHFRAGSSVFRKFPVYIRSW